MQIVNFMMSAFSVPGWINVITARLNLLFFIRLLSLIYALFVLYVVLYSFIIPLIRFLEPSSFTAYHHVHNPLLLCRQRYLFFLYCYYNEARDSAWYVCCSITNHTRGNYLQREIITALPINSM